MVTFILTIIVDIAQKPKYNSILCVEGKNHISILCVEENNHIKNCGDFHFNHNC